ncbi:GntR family transcriptional regulator [Occultella glacieicola]|uniref:GntR family transcriptional regulator n=1 Tax=Occultella glacieicola TaxID=2518684 RepID=A0ABY2E888_9MICO|nr:GntR family transcriptional regulator [Occultella glacieicola]TDE98719.1 GntR family transcriptional regulator [Occultella glacieicola]
MSERNGDPRVPLYQNVKSELLRAIAAGEYTPGEPFITQRELRERFGVSNTTAVKALNDLVVDGLLVRRRGKGTFVAEGPRTARPTKDGADGADASIMCVLSLLHDRSPHAARLIRGVESVCAELGYRMFLSDTKGDPDLEERALLRAARGGAAGVVLYPVEGRAPLPALEGMRRRGVPMVMVDRYRQDVVADAVVADNFAVGFQLTEHLIAAGHTRIAVLWEETDSTSVRDRLAGHLQALQQHGIRQRREFSVLRPYLGSPSGSRIETVRELLALPEPPTAIMCANGYVLASAVHDLAALGVEIPDEIELAGMDDGGPLDLPPLTLVSAILPSEEMGRQAMTILARRIAEPDAGDVEHVVLPVGVRVRDSSTGHLRVVRSQAPGPI